MLAYNDAVFSLESMKQAVLSNKSQVYGGDDPFTPKEELMARVRGFTRGMHCHSAGGAYAWPDNIDLSTHKTMLGFPGVRGPFFFYDITFPGRDE
ncbi:MAG TPA: hypothetical protein VGK99_15580 [Acidobacteriota bacterium]|jgi:hypothetical protein